MIRWQFPVAAGLLVVVSVTSGCAVTGKSASIDSTSRMPFLGMELAPRKKDAAPETQRIRRDGSIPLEPEPARLVVNGPARDMAWRQKKRSPEVKAPLRLPRTDLAETASPAPHPEAVPLTPEPDVIEF